MLLSERITLSPRDVQRSSITVLYGPTPKVRSRSTYIALTTASGSLHASGANKPFLTSTPISASRI
jgi:hypothetical protein